MIVLNEVKIKYEKLDELLKEKFQDIRFSQNINFIIDLKEVIKKIFRGELREEGSLTKGRTNSSLIEEISSDILGIISHYRNYSFKNNKYSAFYFLYSKKECEIFKKEYFSDYKKDYYEKYFKNDINEDIIKKVIKILERIIPIIPNCSFIETSEFDELVYGKFIIEKTPENELNILLSNDEIMFQILNEHTVALNIKGIKSDLIESEKYFKVNEKESFSSNMIPLYLSLCGNKKYNLEGIERIGYKRATNIINALIKSSDIIDNNQVSFPIVFSELKVSKKLKEILIKNSEKIMKNFKIINGNEILYKNKIKIKNQLSVRKMKIGKTFFLDLNSKVFSNFPINIEMILKGEI